MRAFDFGRFNGFARDSLDGLLFKDLWHHDIFNERDMHSCAYFYIRDYFRKQGRNSVYVRCESQLNGMRPDIVIYDRGNPIYVLEFKFFSKLGYINEDSVYEDLNKLADCVEAFPSVKWGFFFMIYDKDENFSISDYRLRKDGFSSVSASSINARRIEGTARRRNGYDGWRTEFDRLNEGHREHA